MIFLKRPQFVKTKWLLYLLILLSAAGWGVVPYRDEARTVTYVIPPGASQHLAAGQELITLPDEIELTIGVKDILVIDNQDDVIHNFGPFLIMPRTTLTKRFDKVRVYESACTFHQDRQMRVVVKPAPWDIFQPH